MTDVILLLDICDRQGRQIALKLDHSKKAVVAAWIEDNPHDPTNKTITSSELYVRLTTKIRNSTCTDDFK